MPERCVVVEIGGLADFWGFSGGNEKVLVCSVVAWCKACCQWFSGWPKSLFSLEFGRLTSFQIASTWSSSPRSTGIRLGKTGSLESAIVFLLWRFLQELILGYLMSLYPLGNNKWHFVWFRFLENTSCSALIPPPKNLTTGLICVHEHLKFSDLVLFFVFFVFFPMWFVLCSLWPHCPDSWVPSLLQTEREGEWEREGGRMRSLDHSLAIFHLPHQNLIEVKIMINRSTGLGWSKIL